jgi:hypothetical protein
MMAGSRSGPVFELINDHAYASILQRVLFEIVSMVPLGEVARSIWVLSVLVWWVCSVCIGRLLARSDDTLVAVATVSTTVALIPLPEIGYIGLGTAIGWILAATMIMVSVSGYIPTSPAQRGALMVLSALTAASHPLAAIAPLVWAVRAVRDSPLRAVLVRFSLAAGFGVAFSLAVNVMQDPPMSYASTWTPLSVREEILSANIGLGGGEDLRPLPEFNPLDRLTSLPGSVRFIITQVLPDPWASNSIVMRSEARKVLQAALIIFVGVLLPLGAIRFLPVRGVRSAVAAWGGAALTSAVEWLLVGSLNNRQYVLIPAICYWAGLSSIAWSIIERLREAKPTVARVMCAGVCSLIPVATFAVGVQRTFRDPFQDNPRPAGMGRYADEEVWKQELAIARSECEVDPNRPWVVIWQHNQPTQVVTWIATTTGRPAATLGAAVILPCATVGPSAASGGVAP